MQTTRRAILATPLLATPFLAKPAFAWPDRPVRIIVPYPPGGASDTTSRLAAEPLARRFGQSFVVENRPGANGIVALEHAANSPPDGHTLLMGNLGPNAINQGLYRTLPYHSIRSFTPIILANKVPLVLMVRADHPARDLAQFFQMAREAPGRLSYASAGPGSSSHLAGELLKTQTGLDLTHVPYRGDAPGVTDLLAGSVTSMLLTTVSALPQARSGRVRVLAVAAARRIPTLPDSPTFIEQGVAGYDVSSWNGVLAPAGLAPDRVAAFNQGFREALQMPEIAARLAALGAEPALGTPGEFAAFIAAEIERWAAVIRASGATAES